ncbi:hypothetical protein VTK26DRAFT_3070 [Humicola hyalothermophila]
MGAVGVGLSVSRLLMSVLAGRDTRRTVDGRGYSVVEGWAPLDGYVHVYWSVSQSILERLKHFCAGVRYSTEWYSTSRMRSRCCGDKVPMVLLDPVQSAILLGVTNSLPRPEIANAVRGLGLPACVLVVLVPVTAVLSLAGTVGLPPHILLLFALFLLLPLPLPLLLHPLPLLSHPFPLLLFLLPLLLYHLLPLHILDSPHNPRGRKHDGAHRTTEKLSCRGSDTVT